MSDVFTIGGTAVDMDAADAIPISFSERFGGIPTLTIQKRGVPLAALPDPWLDKEITWEHDGTLRFVGDIVSVTPSFSSGIGYVLTYQCMGMRNRLDWFPHTDSNTGIDSSPYNLQREDPNYNAARAGRTVGEMLSDVLTMSANAQACAGVGIGKYTGLPTSPALPGATVADLAALTIVPPKPIYFTGSSFGGAIDGFLQQNAPNHRFWIQPDGTMRFLDMRTFPATTLTMGVDPIEPAEVSRDLADCYTRAVGRGAPIAIMGVLKLSDGDITENFAHDGLTVSAAKAAWTPDDFQQPGTAQDTGTCTCTSTTTITVTSSSASTFWGANYWDQSHQQGWINLSSSTLTGYTKYWSARIISCTALTAGGTSTITIDSPLPDLTYDKYTVSGLATGGSVVWTRYNIANTSIWPRVTNQSTYPQPFLGANGSSVSQVSTAFGVILWSTSGSPPYASFPCGITYNPATGDVTFSAPTYIIANSSPPADVWVLLPIQTNPNLAIVPADVSGVPQYEGTAYTVDGMEGTLTLTIEDWRDPGQFSQIVEYLQDYLDSVKDAVCESSVVYYGFYEDAFTLGMSLNIACEEGASYPTGWEALELAVTGVDLEWSQDALDYKTTMHVSNRRAHYSAEMFLKPERTGTQIGTESEVWNPFQGPQGGQQRDQAGDFEDGAAGVPASPRGGSPMGGGSMGGAMPIPTSPEQWAAQNGIATSPDQWAAQNGIATSPEQWAAQNGVATSPEQWMAQNNIPMSLGDMGIPSFPEEYFAQNGIATSPEQWAAQNGVARTPEEFFGGQAQPIPAAANPPRAKPSEHENDDKPGAGLE